MTAKVVVGVDELGAASEVVAAAVAEAVRRSAVLHLVHAGEEPVFAGHLGVAYLGARTPARQRPNRQNLGEVLDQVRRSSPGLLVEGSMALARASDLLVEHSHGADLLVIGHHGHGAVSEVILGSTARVILRRAHCPVLIVPCVDHPAPVSSGRSSLPGVSLPAGSDDVSPVTLEPASADSGHPDPAALPLGAIKHVIVGADGSVFSDAALAWAYDECALWGASLTVIHGWSYAYHGLRAGVAGPRGLVEADAAHALESAIVRLHAAKGTNVTVKAKLVEGNIAEILHREAGTADLVVVGAHGRSLVRRLLLGSVSASLVEHLPCRVVVVPTSIARSLAATF